MRLVDVLIWDHLGQVRVRVVRDDRLLVISHVLEELVGVDDAVCELVCHLLDCELVEHRQAAAQDKSFEGVLRVDVVVIFNVGLLGEELRSGLGGDDEFVHDFAYFSIEDAVRGTRVDLERVAGVDHEIPVVAQGVVALARVLKLDFFTLHI